MVLLCIPKGLGGLGFRDLLLFNQALLANKMAWRIVQNSESVFSKVMLSKHCNKSQFLSVKPKSNSSWGWKSIFWGRGLLIKGLK